MATRLENLNSIKAAVQAVTGAEVKYGYKPPQKSDRGKLVCIVPFTDPSQWQDGSSIKRKLTFAVILIVRTDASQSTGAFEQMLVAWELVEAKLEALIENNNNGHANMLSEAGDGWESDSSTLDDGDEVAVCGSTYEIEYERKLGS